MVSDKRDDCSRDFRMEDQALRLSRYNESLGNRSSTSMKFDWMQLLGEPAKSITDNKAKLGTNDKGRSVRECDLKDNATRPNSDRKHSGDNEFLGFGRVQRKVVDENTGPGLALSSWGLGDPMKSVTNDKSYSLKELDSKDCYGVKATRLDSERNHSRESEYSGLGRVERKLMDKNPKPGVALSSRGSDESVVYKSLARESYKEANSSVRYSRDDAALLEKEYPGLLGSNSRISSGRDRFNAEMIDSTIVHDVLDGKICSKSSVTETCPPANTIPVGEEHESDTYNESWRNKRGNVFRESDAYHVSSSVTDDYSHGYFDYTVDKIDECFYEELSGESKLWFDDSYLRGNKILGNNDLNISPAHKWDEDIEDHGIASGRYIREQYVNQRSPLSEDNHGYERSELSPWSEHGQHNVNYDYGSLFLKDYGYEKSGTFPLMENDQYLDEFSGDIPQRLADSELCLIDESKLMLKRKHDLDDMSTSIYTGNTISGNDERGVKNYSQGGFEQLSADDRESFTLSKKLRYSHSQLRQSEREFYWTLPRSVTEHNSVGKDIMKRLGPQHRDIHASPSNLHVNTPESSVKKRLGPVKRSKPSVKQRLGPSPIMNLTEVSQMKTQNSEKLYRRACYDDNNLIQEEETSIAGVISTNVEPHENSEEFKQLVHRAYYRFVKQMNENSSQRRRILQQGKAGRLKCIVCGSNSKEFVDKKSLVAHTFYSQKVGFRALHLGFHRALCMLMGWKNKIAGGRKWFCELLSDSEATSLKEDHIIWPPVVIIHNSSLNSSDFDERVIISIEALESILRGMGFEERIKVCRGRPANHSIMTVVFNSTLSGLEAAERLHNFYSRTKHGKSDFENIRSCSSSCTREASKASEKKAEHVLYGYLGIAEDLDKLEFETKKCCSVKSKKEIQHSAMHL